MSSDAVKRKHADMIDSTSEDLDLNNLCASKYDVVIKGKHNTGKCVVDVYCVLRAFACSYSPEVDHAIKKLLAPGLRGQKGRKQDLLEAISSIEQAINNEF